MTIVIIVINKRLVKLKFDFLFFEIVRMECVDNTTAARTSGIAGKDINCINDNPNELRLSDAWGKTNPSKRDIGNI
jgi:hypothetical protein